MDQDTKRNPTEDSLKEIGAVPHSYDLLFRQLKMHIELAVGYGCNGSMYTSRSPIKPQSGDIQHYYNRVRN